MIGGVVMNENPEIQTALDNEHLRLLAIGYKISAGVIILYSLFGLMYMFMGIFIGIIDKHRQTSQPPIEWFLAIFGFGIFAVSAIFVVLNFMAAKRLEQRRSKTFCTVIAALNCIGIPYHTILGVFTLVILTRKSIIKLFETNGGAIG
ncbi:MAG: hypothetical protein A2509_08995 [Candidatus Edwardsbacteria bacterium RIFOXYD12_FULL_50_11]|uniref:Uncharacterized protein n=1 Tax=Candidatus Edwardsbacteria bacterium GWF2_54_11 TaxID=1817851 RepID=A0A1F5R3B8_9BACT|nr:MAG: hypothetical protein A2502_02360 [Candidatus Edwardsbacteria bacterium RifOxyC12_full_54_24]OGF08421.1 MAG: hypothetical protein A2024_06870 [Candidatus Edwardsbacteria bacterium GWF2_54_11]OGF09097.1 MAG: hypothetical protein A2273_10815 [Candidatus Edwardsbacteria bacterium RifOxyA12_full_54_48]OGF12378.1 MAG: hypothetical protein A3K15_00780 [Candidatus Edwardsbacteria bacterium GWE2_54_12]OGF17517.1 MAG: hypothetical protein A2509_08995 [Candidatus Edwardsbacteria bacterium RIFOXYD1